MFMHLINFCKILSNRFIKKNNNCEILRTLNSNQQDGTTRMLKRFRATVLC